MHELKDSLVIKNIKRIQTESQGALQFFESQIDIPFEIKRVYYITDAIKNTLRGGHAHKKLKQFIFCPYGEVLIKLTDGEDSEEIMLNQPDKGILILPSLWRDMLWLKDNSVLCVAVSDYYDEKDYIRNYQDYLKYLDEIRG